MQTAEQKFNATAAAMGRDFVVRVVLNGSCIERYVALGGELTRDHAKAARLSREAAFPVARHWEKSQPGACVDVFYADGSENDGRPVSEDAEVAS